MQLNPSKPFLGVFALFVFVYVIYVLLASDPLTRINRICDPVVSWPERIVTSAVRIAAPGDVSNVERSFGTGYMNCRRWTFGVLYRPEYERLKAEEARQRSGQVDQSAREQSAREPAPSARAQQTFPLTPSDGQGGR